MLLALLLSLPGKEIMPHTSELERTTTTNIASVGRAPDCSICDVTGATAMSRLSFACGLRSTYLLDMIPHRGY